MDLLTAVGLFVFNYSSYAGLPLVMIVGWLLWAGCLNVPLAGFVAEQAARVGLRWPMIWAVGAALAPPIVFPLFLSVRGIVERRTCFDHRGMTLRWRGYGLGLLALAAILVLVVILTVFFPPPVKVVRS